MRAMLAELSTPVQVAIEATEGCGSENPVIIR